VLRQALAADGRVLAQAPAVILANGMGALHSCRRRRCR